MQTVTLYVPKTFPTILCIIPGGKKDIHVHIERPYENYYFGTDLKTDFCKIIHG